MYKRLVYMNTLTEKCMNEYMDELINRNKLINLWLQNEWILFKVISIK